mmetsp:Transcript_15446/g.33327  ORF Transcript_15446/g.33327 Transcript_15446/m.33327 type:complete len:221 (-) Transcript_15446:1993-2655(-)
MRCLALHSSVAHRLSLLLFLGGLFQERPNFRALQVRVGHSLVLALVVAPLLGFAVVVHVGPLLQAHPAHFFPRIQELVLDQLVPEFVVHVRDLAPGAEIEFANVLGASVAPGVGIERQVRIQGRLLELGHGFLCRRPGAGAGCGTDSAPGLWPATRPEGVGCSQRRGQGHRVGGVGVRAQQLRTRSSRADAVRQFEELFAGLLGLSEVLDGRWRKRGIGR